MGMIWVYAGPQPERIVVDEACAVQPGVAWGASGLMWRAGPGEKTG